MPLGLFLLTHLVLFAMGAVGTFLNRRNFIIMLMCIEVMLLATNLVFLTASVALDDITGQLLALWVMTAAAAETALGLALCVLYYRLRATLDVELINLMKGSYSFQNETLFYISKQALLQRKKYTLSVSMVRLNKLRQTLSVLQIEQLLPKNLYSSFIPIEKTNTFVGVLLKGQKHTYSQ
jgi:NADH-quinone oxidoreductase subunit K